MDQNPFKIFANSKLRSKIMPLLKDSYKTIDIRGVVGRLNDNKWHYVVLKIRLTKETSESIFKLHRNKNAPLFNPNSTDGFGIVFERKNINDLFRIIDSVQNKTLRINGIDFLPIGTEYQNIYQDEQFQQSDSLYTTAAEQDGYNHRLVYAGMPETPLKVFENNNINYSRIISSFDNLNYYLDVQNLHNANNSLIVFPIYCKILDVSKNTDRDYIGRCKIHKSLINGSDVHLTLKDNEVLNYEKFGLSKLSKMRDRDPTLIDVLIPRISHIESAIEIEATVHHEVLGVLASKTHTWRIVSPDDTNILTPNHVSENEFIEYIHFELDKLLKLPLEQRIKLEESLHLEFKSSLRWDYKNGGVSKNVELSAIKEIPAFMNAKGGLLIIGVDDNHEILGLQKDYDTLSRKNWDGWCQHLTNLIYGRYKMDKAYQDFFYVKKENINGKEIASIIVRNCFEPVWLNEKTLYVRGINGTISLVNQEADNYIKGHWGSH